MNLKSMVLILLLLPAAGCMSERVSVVPFHEAASEIADATPSSRIPIYRSAKFRLEKYSELGMVVVTGYQPDINQIYHLMRKKAGRRGADLIVGFELDVEKVTETYFDSDGDVSTETRLLYSASGTLLRRIK